MGDSDDEYDRKRRDKFRGERTEGYSRETRRGSTDGRRDDWPESSREPSRAGWPMSRVPRPDYREYRSGTRERYSPVPPMKRYKPEGWDDRRYGDFAFRDPWLHDYPPERSYAPPHPRAEQVPSASLVLDTQPAIMSFKAFLQSQDDTITDEEAMAKYNEYKQEFKRQQLNEFFVAHKDEEWFKIKYHPEESVKRKEEQLQFLKARLAVFSEFLEKGYIDNIALDADATENLIRLMDRVVVRLEGGDENDWLQIEKQQEVAAKPVMKSVESVKDNAAAVESDDEKKIKKDEKENEGNEKSEDDDDDDEDDEGKVKKDETKEDVKKEKEELPKKGIKRKRDYDFESGSESDEDKEDKSSKDGKDDNKADSGDEEVLTRDDEQSLKSAVSSHVAKPDIDDDVIDVDDKRKDLHKTSSIFFRNLSPAITKTEVEAMCKRYPGFLRVALAEPQYERRWFRRGWVTFERSVNIKEICWNLNNIRLKDCELGAIVNKDLTRRVRTVNGITGHKQVVRHDIKLAAHMAHTLDNRYSFWTDKLDGENGTGDSVESFGLVSNNPVLKNITDYLIEEASAEEEELLGGTGGNDSDSANPDATIERDEILNKVLDKLLLYLRIIYSIDYYNHCEYPQEDEMPNRCGLIHVRGPPPSIKVSQDEIQDYCKQFKTKVTPLVTPAVVLNPEDLAKFGAKDADKEVEKFIQANTQELAKDKWLCPLSGKKFKGPDFVRKHIQNKHAEKVQEVIKEVEYFNNYLMDPKRPQLPEHPGLKTTTGRKEPEALSTAAIPPPAREPLGYPPPFSYGYPHRGSFYGGYGGFRGGIRGGFPIRGRGGLMPPQQDFRPVIHYRDLDAPREPDDFI